MSVYSTLDQSIKVYSRELYWPADSVPDYGYNAADLKKNEKIRFFYLNQIFVFF